MIHLLTLGCCNFTNSKNVFYYHPQARLKFAQHYVYHFMSMPQLMLTNAQHMHTNTRCMNTHTCTVRGEFLLEWWVFRFYSTTYKYTQSTYTCVHIIRTHICIQPYTYSHTQRHTHYCYITNLWINHKPDGLSKSIGGADLVLAEGEGGLLGLGRSSSIKLHGIIPVWSP